MKIQKSPHKMRHFLIDMFEHNLSAEENFKKNKANCVFATTDGSYILGFTVSGRPQSLLKGDELDKTKMKSVDLELIWGNVSDFSKYKAPIERFISKGFVEEDNE